jgi:nucleotide-binding universal stress UspA family protein
MTAAAKISRVLVGVELDEASASALIMAGALASAWNAEITVFHSAAQEAPAYFTAAQIEALEAEREQGRAGIADDVRAFAAPYLPTAIRVVVGEGPPQNGMLAMAPSFDLIVVGTHRRHGPRRWWLGSVAEAVVRNSPRPVLVVPSGTAAPETRQAPMILGAGGDGDAADAWIEALRTAVGGQVVRSPDIRQCAPDRLQTADLIVLFMPPGHGGHAELSGIVQVLKECVRPVLFVPPSGRTVERRLS